MVAFGHNELWRPEAANKVSVTTQMLWPLATTNCGGRKPQKWLLSWLKYRQMATLLVALAPAAWYTCRAATIAKAGTVACIHGELLGAFGYEWLLYYFMNVINIRD